MIPAWSLRSVQLLERIGEIGRALGLPSRAKPLPPNPSRVFVIAGSAREFETWKATYPGVDAVQLTEEKQLQGLSDPAYATFGTWYEVYGSAHLFDCVSRRGHHWRSR